MNPQLLTRKFLAKMAAERWKQHYYKNGYLVDWYSDRMKSIYIELSNLGSDPNANDVDKIIGNTSWTQCQCNQCGKNFEEVVIVGEPTNWESSTARLCKQCVVNALGLFGED